MAFAVVAALAVSLAVPGDARSASRAVSYPSVHGLSLTAAQVKGPAPFADLRAALDPSSASGRFNWSFGDGTSYQEVARSYSEVAHEYTVPGTYQAQVSVTSALGEANASLAIAAVQDTLSARIVASPTVGPAPLTVNFTAEPSGGTGTYIGFAWNFGDGDNGSGEQLAYTYTKPGVFNASLTVTDSSGRSVTVHLPINVPGAAASPPAAPSPIGAYATDAVGVAAVLAVAAVASIAYLAVVSRRADRRGPTSETAAPPAPPTPTEAGRPVSPEELALAGSGRAGPEESVSLAERILVHLYWYGRSSIDGVARVDASQGGMARRLGVAQNSLSKALRRLVDAGALRVELEHVPGAPRRLKTYSLTSKGEAVAKRIRADSEPGSSP
ncbi:MAG: PKD domain-containing protein [Thermoplasmata archaeon]|nr:PKD domain-containing protein [Thermoplasmata archaeon]